MQPAPATPTPAPPPAQPEVKLTAEQMHEQSLKDNLHDEMQIKLLNANLTVMKETKKNEEGYSHLMEVIENFLLIMTGIANHKVVGISIIKEKAKEKAVELIANPGKRSEREIAIEVANVLVEGLAEMFSNLDWVTEQTDLFQHITDDQVPETGIVKKTGKAVKRIIFSPVKITTGIVGKAGHAALEVSHAVTFGIFRKGNKVK